MAFCVPIGCVRFITYCGKMYSCHLSPYGGLVIFTGFLSAGNNLSTCIFPRQAHEDAGYIKLVVKEECKEHVPGPVQRVLKSFHNEVSDFQINTLKTLC